MSRLRLLPLAAALILAACGDDAADAPGADAPAVEAPGTANPLDPGASPGQALTDDEAALASYTLTMERVEAWSRASQNLQRLAEEDPALAERWDAENADAESFDEMIAQIEAEPRARAAVEEAGISVRDYVLTTMALLQAMFAQAAMDMTQDAPVPEGVNPANVQFVRDHQAEIQALFEAAGLEE